MKRFTSIVMICILVMALFTFMGTTAFAEESFVDSALETVRGFVTEEKLAELKETLFSWADKVIAFAKDESTWDNIVTILMALAAFIIFPILLFLLVIVYLIIALMIIIAGVLVAIVEIILTIFAGQIPM